MVRSMGSKVWDLRESTGLFYAAGGQFSLENSLDQTDTNTALFYMTTDHKNAEKAVQQAEEARKAAEEAALKAAAEAEAAAERKRIAAEKAAQEAEEERLAAEEAAKNQISEEELKAQQKAARDLLYAKRKARR